MRILLTGATGFVGREVVRQLCEAHHELRIVVRNERSPAALNLVSKFKVEVRQGDLLDPNSLRHLAIGVEAVVHLVGIISECGKSTFENVHRRATQSMVHLAQTAKVKRFVQMSALGTRAGAASRYHQTKWQAEETVRNSGLAYTIFRPSLIYGPGDHFVNLYARMIRFSPVVPLLGRRDGLFQPIHVKEVAAAFAQSLSEPAAVGQNYDLCGSERMTLGEMVKQIMAVLRRRRPIVWIPAGLAKAQAGFLEWMFPALLCRAAPLNRDQLLMLQEDNIGDEKPANIFFGLKHPEFSHGIREYLVPGQMSMP